jgi:quercetin dioxygenase-like cupin family protein
MWAPFGKLLAGSKTLRSLLENAVFETTPPKDRSSRSLFRGRVKSAPDGAGYRTNEESGKSGETIQQARQAGGVKHVPPGEGRSIWIVGDTYAFKAVSEDTNGAFMLFEASVPPQSGPPPHRHHREDEAYYILEGTFEILDNDRTFTASAGSFVHIPRGTLHRFKNVGETTARMLVLFTPAGFEKFLFEVGQPAEEGGLAPAVGSEEIERTLAAAPKYGMEISFSPEE